MVRKQWVVVGIQCTSYYEWSYRNEYEIIVGDEKGICLLYDIRKTEGNTVLGTVGQYFLVFVFFFIEDFLFKILIII